MSRIFITGSTDGLGRFAAGVLMGEGHEVVLHARSRERASALGDLLPAAAGVVIGDLSSAAQTRALADQVNDIGRMDAVIHTPSTRAGSRPGWAALAQQTTWSRDTARRPGSPSATMRPPP